MTKQEGLTPEEERKEGVKMTGEILARLNIKAGQPVTQKTLGEAKKLWVEIYLFFMLLTAPTNLMKHQKIENMRTKLAEVNELIQDLEI